MKRAIKGLLKKAPFFRNLEENIRNLEEHVRRQGAYPVGHYYSPIPSQEDVLTYLRTRKPPNKELIGINLNEQKQYDLLNEYAQFYKDLPFPEKLVASSRYYYDNSWFSYSDAIFLYCFLRKYQPKRIVEVGSGFSSAVMLDTIDSIFSQRPEITFIEPYPDRLNSLLRDKDRQQIELIDRKIQEVPFDIFSTLKSGDFLFIDSSHVVKCGSDLQLLMFEILPRIQPGVFVHFHDVFYPFDYPSEWLTEGRYWNENYFLRAFLAYNSEWSILFFNTYAHYMFSDIIKEKMPLCMKNPGGSLYIQRNQIV
ncbi:class I SAM-dependent methyltransferase [Pseudanabaena sp. PCC 6802]|uniref:class I SAM-dependent methyltransferase n=1 Tax=Pseudanabaena sp. PCC 6802 TaxID=118173 RepID=UPI00034D8C21|nr:class I SAM-dependent methyltransferase [Pseudanabaena sp. PCC 6802]